MALEVQKHLQEHLESNPHITHVHFNSKGEWVFKPRKTHLNTKTRTQVLSSVGVDAPETNETNEIKRNSKK